VDTGHCWGCNCEGCLVQYQIPRLEGSCAREDNLASRINVYQLHNKGWEDIKKGKFRNIKIPNLIDDEGEKEIKVK